MERINSATHKQLTWIAVALTFMFPAVICFLLILVMAYINPSKSVIVYTNVYGEATIELVLFSIIAVANFITLTCFWTIILRTWKR